MRLPIWTDQSTNRVLLRVRIAPLRSNIVIYRSRHGLGNYSEVILILTERARGSHLAMLEKNRIIYVYYVWVYQLHFSPMEQFRSLAQVLSLYCIPLLGQLQGAFSPITKLSSSTGPTRVTMAIRLWDVTFLTGEPAVRGGKGDARRGHVVGKNKTVDYEG